MNKIVIAFVLVSVCTANSAFFLDANDACDKCSAPNNCYHPNWASPCSQASDQATCEASSAGAVWCPSKPTPPSPSDCDKCSLPDNCFHPSWASPCSQASDQSACEASSGGAVWCPGKPTPPGPKGDAFVGAYLGLYAKSGLKGLQAMAENASTLPITRLWLAFISPTMYYEPNSNTLNGTGLNNSSTESDGGFAEVKDAIKKLETSGVQVFLSMGGWDYNCFSYFYARYSVGGYGTHTPNYWKIKQYGKGNLDNCTVENQFCYTCEPPTEHSSMNDFGLFPEPAHSSVWQNAQKYVEQSAGTPAPEWHSDWIPKTEITDPHNKSKVLVPGDDQYVQKNRNPYEDLVLLAKDLGASGVDVDYEEFWHADTFKVVASGGAASTGPWELHQTVYKYAAIVKTVVDSIKQHAPTMRLSTAAGAVGGWSGKWWGGNMKGLWLEVKQKYPDLISFMETGPNSGGINVMTYDLSKNQSFHECPDDSTCALNKQVDFYMNNYKSGGITANVGYEIGTPAYPSLIEDKQDQLPLSSDELSLIIANTQTKVTGGFFWSVYKPADGQATPTQVAQAICNTVMKGNARCKGSIPEIPEEDN